MVEVLDPVVRAVDGSLASRGCPLDVVGLDQVALDQLDPDLGEGDGLVGIADERLDDSPRSISCWQTLAPVSPVPPVTKTVPTV